MTNSKRTANRSDLGSVIADATMRAAANILERRGALKTVDVDALCVALRKYTLAALDRVLDQGKALLDGGQAGWIEQLVRVECVDAARLAVEEVLS
jgi:hypothetical protein